MSDQQATPDRGGTCAECGETVAADGKQAGVTGGRLICIECIDERVAFVAECLDCDWSTRTEARTTSRHDAKQNAQMKANTHEREQQVFEDESHSTVWREADTGDSQ